MSLPSVPAYDHLFILDHPPSDFPNLTQRKKKKKGVSERSGAVGWPGAVVLLVPPAVPGMPLEHTCKTHLYIGKVP